MSAEKLPPDGYELGPGWRVERNEFGEAYYANSSGSACTSTPTRACVAMGAIVRKAALPVGWAKAQPGTLCQHRDEWPDGTVDCRAAAFAFGRVRLGPNCEVTQHACAGHVAEMSAPIIRKAEAPTFVESMKAAGRELAERGIAIDASKWLAEMAPEQPSGNAGGLGAEAPTPDCLRSLTAEERAAFPVLTDAQIADALAKGQRDREIAEARRPPEAPAAPVGEPSEARHLAHAFVTANRLDCEKERPSPEPRPEHFPLCDRLTDVIQRAIDPRDARIAALEAEVAEAKGAMKRERVYVVEAEVAAAVQAERERASFYAEKAVQKRCGWRTAAAAIKNGDPAP